MTLHPITQLLINAQDCNRPLATHQQAQLFGQLFEHSADATLLWCNQRLVFCNQAAIDLLGYTTRPELLQRYFWQLSLETKPGGADLRTQTMQMMEIATQTGMSGGSNRLMAKLCQLT